MIFFYFGKQSLVNLLKSVHVVVNNTQIWNIKNSEVVLTVYRLIFVQQTGMQPNQAKLNIICFKYGFANQLKLHPVRKPISFVRHDRTYLNIVDIC